MSKPKIRFTYNGKNYQVDYRAYEDSLAIVLPDGTAIRVGMWLEIYPPLMGSTKEVPHLFKSLPAAEVVQQLGNAILAEEVC